MCHCQSHTSEYDSDPFMFQDINMARKSTKKASKKSSKKGSRKC